MKMKTVMTMLLAGAVSLSLLTGCGGSKAEQTAPGSEAVSVEGETSESGAESAAEASESEAPESGSESTGEASESEASGSGAEGTAEASESETPESGAEGSESEAPGSGAETQESEAPESEEEGMAESAEESEPDDAQAAETDMGGNTEGNTESITEETPDYGYSNLNSFDAQTLDGGFFSQQDLAGVDLTVINIWQTTCGPCIVEMPELAELEKSLPDNVQLITWCLDGAWYPEATQKILDEAGFEGITIVSGNEDLESLYNELMYTPTTVFVDSMGNQVCEALIGSGDDTIARYTAEINKALTAMGKEEI